MAAGWRRRVVVVVGVVGSVGSVGVGRIDAVGRRRRDGIVSPVPRSGPGAYGTEPAVRAVTRARRR